MSSLLERNPEDYQDYDPVELPVLKRDFAADFTVGDGRTVDVRVVPYGVSAEVSDGGPVYREEWVAGCFDEQLVAGHRLKVLLTYGHSGSISNVVGKGIALRSEADGLRGSFRVLETQDGDKTLELVGAGILDGVSLEAHPKKSVRTADGVVRRMRAHLHNVALTRYPAFKDAKVLAVRENILFDEELLPVKIDPDVLERCRRLGIRLPERYEAHPADTDTPSEEGTSTGSTRQETVTLTEE